MPNFIINLIFSFLTLTFLGVVVLGMIQVYMDSLILFWSVISLTGISILISIVMEDW